MSTPDPVAWLCELAQEDGSTKTMIVQENPDGLRFNDFDEPSPFRVTPLYAAQPKREPLTEAQIEQGRRDTFSTENPFCPCDSKTMRKAVRWAEAEHGIKGSE